MHANVESFQVNEFGSNTTVKLNLIHNILSITIPEVRFDLFQKIDSVKVFHKNIRKIIKIKKAVCEKKFGSDSSSLQLYLQDQSNKKPSFLMILLKKKKIDGNTLCAMYENDRDLGFYSPQDGYFIYVVDNNPNSLLKELEDLSQVEKYVMSEEDYNKLPSFFFLMSFLSKIISFNRQFPKIQTRIHTSENETH